MLVTEALNELKTLGNRINRALDGAEFVIATKTSDKNARPGMTKEEFCDKAKASKDSVFALIKRRELIKSAIIASNAITEVEIAGQKMTVAKAIDTKDSITYYKLLLNQMKRQYIDEVAKVNISNKAVEDNVDKLILAAYGKEGKEKISEKDYESIAIPYRTANEASLVDPLNLKAEIDKLEDYIDSFTSNVDAQLQISNCVTFIEIDD